MSETESLLPCAVAPDRETAERFKARLADQGIEAEIGPPGTRFHGLGPGAWELRVAAREASRARAVLNNPV